MLSISCGQNNPDFPSPLELYTWSKRGVFPQIEGFYAPNQKEYRLRKHTDNS